MVEDAECVGLLRAYSSDGSRLAPPILKVLTENSDRVFPEIEVDVTHFAKHGLRLLDRTPAQRLLPKGSWLPSLSAPWEIRATC